MSSEPATSGREDVKGQLGQVRSTEDLLDGLPVDGEVQRLTDQRVGEGTVGVGTQRVDDDVGNESSGALDDQTLVAGGEQRRDLLRRDGRLAPLHVDGAGDDLLEHGLVLLPEGDLDAVDVGLAQVVGLGVPVGVALEHVALVRHVLDDLVRTVLDDVLAQVRAVGEVVEVLDRLRGGEAEQGEDVDEVARRLGQRELHRLVVDGSDAGDVVGLDVLADRFDLGRHVGEAVAELAQAGDRVR